jgi:hypothetical protein
MEIRKRMLRCSLSDVLICPARLVITAALLLASAAAAQSTLPSVSNSGTGSFSLNATNLIVNQGSSGSSTITVTPIDGYRGTVDLTFTTSDQNDLQNMCYSFSNMNGDGDGTVAIIGTEAVTTQLTLDTNVWDCLSDNPARSSRSKHLRSMRDIHSSDTSSSSSRGAIAAGFAGILFAGLFGRRRARLWTIVLVIVLSGACLTFSGCGASNSPTGTYTVTVTGQDSVSANIPTASTTFTFTIQ